MQINVVAINISQRDTNHLLLIIYWSISRYNNYHDRPSSSVLFLLIEGWGELYLDNIFKIQKCVAGLQQAHTEGFYSLEQNLI